MIILRSRSAQCFCISDKGINEHHRRVEAEGEAEGGFRVGEGVVEGEWM